MTPSRACVQCGAPLTTSHKARMYCSRPCNRAAATARARAARVAARRDVRCATCGAGLSERRAARFCSRRCADIARGMVKAVPPQPRRCELPACEAEYLPATSLQRCCSRSHVRKLYRIERAAEIKAARQPWDDQRRDAYQRRRASKKQATTGRPVLRSEIAERDHWKCQLCGDPVDKAVVWPDPFSPSLDHIVPLSKGGAHDPDNVQLAHLRCNVAKGTSTAA